MTQSDRGAFVFLFVLMALTLSPGGLTAGDRIALEGGSASGDSVVALASRVPLAQDPDFLFQQPRLSVGLRGGMFLHRAGSEIHDFTTDQFTLERSDFQGLSLGVEGTLWLTSQLELALGLDGSRLTRRSVDREWVDFDDGSDIRQTTRLRHGPSVSFGVRWFVRDRGQRLSDFVWLPSEWNAFVGMGGGVMGYRLEQWGDFVDEAEEIIFNDRFESEGAAFFPYVSGGLEIGLTPRTSVTVESRYHWGKGDLARDFSAFEPVDLAGLRLTAGLSYRF